MHQKNGHAGSYLLILSKLLESAHISLFPLIELVESLVTLYLVFVKEDELSQHTELILNCFSIIVIHT